MTGSCRKIERSRLVKSGVSDIKGTEERGTNQRIFLKSLPYTSGGLTVSASELLGKRAPGAARCLDAEAGEAAPPTGLGGDPAGLLIPKIEDCLRDGARIEEWAGPTAGPTYLEIYFGIPRSTLHWWRRHNDVIALRKGSRRHVFPLAQFIDGRPVPGIRSVLSSISNPRLAWMWMIHPSPLLNGRVPIEMLRMDLSAEVASASRDFSLVASS